ncbi:MAG TPA: SRPBCC family protein [Spirochaetota bacterium]|nr:SRPBCC family protein [Spirochaetota bacterium]
MIKARLRTTLSCSPKEAFRHFESIASLGALKKELLGARIARREPGLEIADAHLRFPFFKHAAARLKYTTVPETYAELKQIKGPLSEYRWAFSFSGIGGNTRVDVEVAIRLPLGPMGFILGLVIGPFIKRKMRRELTTLEKLTAPR